MASAMIAVPVLIRCLGLEDYGIWTLVSSTLVLIGLAEGGLGSSTAFFMSKELGRGKESDPWKMIYLLGIAMLLVATIVLALTLLAAPQIVSSFPNLSESQRDILVPTFRWGSIAVWFRMVQSILVGTEQSYGKYIWSNTINTLQIVISNCSLIWLALMDMNVLRLMQSQSLIIALFFSVHAFLSFKLLIDSTNRIDKPSWDRKQCFEILKYSISVWFTSMGSVVFSQVDKILIGAILGPSFLGIYAAITTVTSKINAIAAAAVQPSLPGISRLANDASANREKILSGIKTSSLISISLSIGLGSLVITFSEQIMEILLGENNRPEYLGTFIIATIIYSLYSANSSSYYLLMALNEEVFLMKTVLFCSIFSILLITVGSYFGGLHGAILGNIPFLGMAALTWRVLEKIELKKMVFLNWFLIDALLLLASAGLAVLLSSMPLIISVVLACLQLLLAAKILYGGIDKGIFQKRVA